VIIYSFHSFKAEPSIPEPKASTSKSPLAVGSPIKLNKENLTPSKNPKSILNMSGTMIVSFSPAATPFSEHYGTPNSVFSEANDSSFASLNSTLTETREIKNSSMHLIDLTTPNNNKLNPKRGSPQFSKETDNKSIDLNFNSKTPTNRVKTFLLRSAIKNSSNMTNRSFSLPCKDTKIPQETSIEQNKETLEHLNLTGIDTLLTIPVKRSKHDLTESNEATQTEENNQIKLDNKISSPNGNFYIYY
jgi:hypothetical protein